LIGEVEIVAGFSESAFERLTTISAARTPNAAYVRYYTRPARIKRVERLGDGKPSDSDRILKEQCEIAPTIFLFGFARNSACFSVLFDCRDQLLSIAVTARYSPSRYGWT
jgi:hypothetical protein